MNQVPVPLDETPSPLVRATTLLLVPIMLVVALPLLLLLIVILYLAAMFHGAKVFVFTITGKSEPLPDEFQRPHYLDIQVRALPDESNLPPKG